MKPLHPFTSLARVAACCALGAVVAATPAGTFAQNTVVPLPFTTTVAGLAAGSGNTQCSTASDIPNNAGVHTGDGCLPTQALLTGLYGAFTDAIGNIYITENGTNVDIRVIYKGGAALTAMLTAANANVTNFTPIPGRIYTLAGSLGAAITVKNGTKYSCNGQTTGPVGLDSAGNGCPAAQAYLKPRGLAVDANGNVFFVTNSPGNIARVIYAGGTQVANLITAENPGVTPQVGYVYKLTGQSTAGYSGDNAIASAAAIIVARDVTVDSSGNVYLSDGTSAAATAAGNNVRVIYGGGTAPAGISNPTLGFIYTFAGGSGCTQPATSCPVGDTGDNGPARSATLNGPYTLFVDRFDNVFITEYLGGRLRVVYNGGTIGGIANPTAGNIYTYAGGGSLTTENTAANQLLFGTTQTSGVDAAGNIYLEDGTTKRIWHFDAATAVGYIVAGRTSGSAPAAGVSCSGTGATAPVSVDSLGDGCPSTQASLSDTGRISFDPQGNFYVGENGNGVARRLSYNTQFPAANVGATAAQLLAVKAIAATTLTTAAVQSNNGANSTEFVNDPTTSTCSTAATLAAAQVCVFGFNFTPQHDGLRVGGFVSTVNSNVVVSEAVSGLGIGADLALDPATTVVAQKISSGPVLNPSGIATDLAGNIYVASKTGNEVVKGSTSSNTLVSFISMLNAPSGLAIDSLQNLYIADTGNNRVVVASVTNSTPTAIATGLNAPQGVAVDAFNNVFVSDTGNNRVVEVAPNGVQSIVTPLTGLSAPTQLTFDSLGNLFVVDSGNSRIVELPVNGSQTVVTLPAGVKPAGIAVDPSGTLYVADAAGLQLLVIPPGGSATGTTLLTGLVKPAALSVDPDANVYLADSGVASVTYLRRNLANITFPITNVNQSSTSPINVNNVGNAAFNFPTTTLYTRTGSTQFTLAPSTTNGCGSGVSYAPGSECSFTATFAPTAKGAATASVTFNTTAANTGTATALLTGNGQQLVTTTSTLSITSPTGAITYGQAVVLTATVTPTSNAGAPTGTVTFTVDNKAQAAQPYGTGTYTLTLNPGVGAHTVSVAFSGDGLYASSSANTSFTVAKAATATALNVAAVNSNGTITLTFTATVSSTTATGETGTVSFYAGSVLLNTIALSTATRTASYSTSTLNFATNSFTAVYSGDGNFAGSTSVATAPTGDFAIGTSTTAVTIPQGGVANLSFVLAPLYNASGTITPSCTGMPANSLCRFTPATITLNGALTGVQLQLFTNVSSTLASNSPAPLAPRGELFLATLVPLSLLAFARRSRRLRVAALACSVMLLTSLSLAGCGSGSPAATQSQGLVTPTGTYTVQVVFAGAAPLTTHTTTISMTVIPNNTGF